MAIGAIAVLNQAGLSVPEDISVVGFDDVPETSFSHPPLTTVRQPMIQLGQAAVRMLVQAIESPGMPPQQLRMDVELIERQSVKQLDTTQIRKSGKLVKQK
jgi:DNA-binding LacI/PurR family transcriptional regulator